MVSLCENWEKSHYFEYFVKISYTRLYVLDHKIKAAVSYDANENFLDSQYGVLSHVKSRTKSENLHFTPLSRLKVCNNF